MLLGHCHKSSCLVCYSENTKILGLKSLTKKCSASKACRNLYFSEKSKGTSGGFCLFLQLDLNPVITFQVPRCVFQVFTFKIGKNNVN